MGDRTVCVGEDTSFTYRKYWSTGIPWEGLTRPKRKFSFLKAPNQSRPVITLQQRGKNTSWKIQSLLLAFLWITWIGEVFLKKVVFTEEKKDKQNLPRGKAQWKCEQVCYCVNACVCLPWYVAMVLNWGQFCPPPSLWHLSICGDIFGCHSVCVGGGAGVMGI